MLSLWTIISEESSFHVLGAISIVGRAPLMR
uniref:Uncharacterized protein n=1 Tax=Myoviridae sp. ctwwN25 TaxID=2825209 RepID=A0A8S5PQ87_9CAUD|nr:MAG TPA: hypothetical protein [Myoviridae sp. ctwwN25]